MIEIGLLEWLGYLASALVLISLLMSSIIKLRWINLAGSLVFATYGFAIGALPVGISNLAITGINIYYLIKIYKSKDYFKILPISGSLEFLDYFLDFYKIEIDKFFPDKKYDIQKDTVGLFILRNMVPAGVFIASKVNNETLLVELDFAIPEYRDFKIGKYLFDDQKEYFYNIGIKEIRARAMNKYHAKYLYKMGFILNKENSNDLFVKTI